MGDGERMKRLPEEDDDAAAEHCHGEGAERMRLPRCSNVAVQEMADRTAETAARTPGKPYGPEKTDARVPLPGVHHAEDKQGEGPDPCLKRNTCGKTEQTLHKQ